MTEDQATYYTGEFLAVTSDYRIDKMGETWFLWTGGEVIRTGSIDTVLAEIKRREG